MNVSAITKYTADLWDDEIVPTLCEYVKIPNKSPAFDKDWKTAGHMQTAVLLLKNAAEKFAIANLSIRVVELSGRTPLLLIDVPATGNSQGNILCYGHYDKQPEFSGWQDGLGPWIPVLRNGRLYGRGGADDGYAMFAALAAIAALEEQNTPHPRCCILIEGCEESGSFDLPYYIDALKDEIGAPDLLICLDAECGNYDQLWLTTSLRGLVSGTLNAKVLDEGIHSGGGGGIVPSSFRILRAVLERVEHAESGELHESLSCEIPVHIHEEVKLAAETLGDTVVKRYPWHGKTQPGQASHTELLLRNSWYPSLATVGLGGAPAPEEAGNTLRPETSVKLVFRLPPNVDAKQASNSLIDIFQSDPPHSAHVSFKVDAAESGWSASKLNQSLMDSLDRASRATFGAPMRQMGCGGTIPFMAMLGEQFPDCQFVVTGVLGPHSNAHGPNEFLEIQTGKNVTASMAMVIADFAESFTESH